MMNDIFRTALTSIASIGVLFILTKLMGYRQMSQLSMFDYINGITIGSIAAEMATANNPEWIMPAVAMTVYALVVLVISFATNKSIVLRRFFVGSALVLYENGKLYEKSFKKGHLDINEFLTICRNNGYYDLKNLHCCVLEANGKISFLQHASDMPVTLKDLNLASKEEIRCANLIIDGKIMPENLQGVDKDASWLRSELKKQNTKLEEVFLAVYSPDKNLTVYKKNDETIEDIWI